MHWEFSLIKGIGMLLNSPVCKYRLCLTRVLKWVSLAESLCQRRIQMQSFSEAVQWIQFILKVPFRPGSQGMRQTWGQCTRPSCLGQCPWGNLQNQPCLPECASISGTRQELFWTVRSGAPRGFSRIWNCVPFAFTLDLVLSSKEAVRLWGCLWLCFVVASVEQALK